MTDWKSDPLPPQTAAWACQSLGQGVTTLLAAEPLLGGMASAVHRLHLRQRGRPLTVVLRRFTLADWLLDEPDLAAHEAAALETAAAAPIPTPELLAVDAMGEHTDVPALLMTDLPGSVTLPHNPSADWLTQAAAALLAIHLTATTTLPWRYFPWNREPTLQPPPWTTQPQLWQRAIEILQSGRPPASSCFIHRDYHPTNLLWQNGRLSGVVDWVNACIGPPGIDIGHCRLNLVQLYSLETADRLLAAYDTAHQAALGCPFPYDPYWDLITLTDSLPGPEDVYIGWRDLGVRHLTTSLVQQRVEAYLGRLLTHF